MGFGNFFSKILFFSKTNGFRAKMCETLKIDLFFGTTFVKNIFFLDQY